MGPEIRGWYTLLGEKERQDKEFNKPQRARGFVEETRGALLMVP